MARQWLLRLLLAAATVAAAYGNECDCSCDGGESEDDVEDYTVGVDISGKYGFGVSSQIPIDLKITKSAECTEATDYSGCMVTFQYTKVVDPTDAALREATGHNYGGSQTWVTETLGLSWVAFGFSKSLGKMVDYSGYTRAVVGSINADGEVTVNVHELLSDDASSVNEGFNQDLTDEIVDASFSQDVDTGTTQMTVTLPLSFCEVYDDAQHVVPMVFSHGKDNRFPRFHGDMRGFFPLNIRAIESGVAAEEILGNLVLKLQLTVWGVEKPAFDTAAQDIFKVRLGELLGVAADKVMENVLIEIILGYTEKISVVTSVTLPESQVLRDDPDTPEVETELSPALVEFYSLLDADGYGVPNPLDPSDPTAFPDLIPGASKYSMGGQPKAEETLVDAASGGCFFDGADQYAMAQCFTSYSSLEDPEYNVELEAEFENTQDLNAEFRISWSLLGYAVGEDGQLDESTLETGCRHRIDNTRELRSVEQWADEDGVIVEGGRADGCEFIEILLQSRTAGWLGLGFMQQGVKHGMSNTDIVWGMVQDGGLEIIDAYAQGIFPPERDYNYPNGTNNLFNEWGAETTTCAEDDPSTEDDESEQCSTTTAIRFTRKLQADDNWDRSIFQQKSTPIVFGYSRQGADDLQLYHGPTRGFGQVLFWENLRICDESDYFPVFSETCNDEGYRTMEVNWFEKDEIIRGCLGEKPAAKDDILCEYVPFSSIYGIVVLIFSLIGCLFSLGATGWVIYNWNLPIVKYSQRPFCLIICFGGFFLSLSPVLMLGEGSTPVCQLGLWMFHLSFEFLVVPLFLKVNRIFQVMQNKSLKRKKISDLQLTINIFMYVFIDVLILLFWTVFDMYEKKEVLEKVEPFSFLDNQISHSYCTSDGRLFSTMSILFKLFILVLGCYYSYQARNISDIFSESKQLMIIMMTISGMASITLFISYGSESIPQTLKLTVQAAVISTSVMIVLGGTFIPKHIKFGKIKNTKELWSVNKTNKTQNNTQTKTQTQSLKTADGAGDGELMELESAEDFVLALTTLLEKVDDFELTDEIQDHVENIISHLNALDEEDDDEENDDDNDGEEGDKEDDDGEDDNNDDDKAGEDGDKDDDNEDGDKEEDDNNDADEAEKGESDKPTETKAEDI
jgi:hypothetical protein